MPMLYTIALNRTPRGSRGVYCVKAREAALYGHLNAETGKIEMPCPDAVREALPACYRKAFDRQGGHFTFTTERNGQTSKVAYLALKGSRGFPLCTVYATPYYFDGTTRADWRDARVPA